jgi:hypothetical protein
MTTSKPDLPPDTVNWKDTGCELFPACLNCPLPHCIEEEPRGKQKLQLNHRNSRMAELKRRGESIGEIARLFRVSQRTVQRALAGGSAAGGVRNG